MIRRAALRVMLAVVAGAAGACARAEPPFSSVEITLSGKAGHAHRSVVGDGKMHGGHASGLPGPPSIHMADGVMAPDDLERLAALVARLDPAAADDGVIRTVSYRKLRVTDGNGETFHFTAVNGAAFGSPAVEEVFSFLARQRVGGW